MIVEESEVIKMTFIFWLVTIMLLLIGLSALMTCCGHKSSDRQLDLMIGAVNIVLLMMWLKMFGRI